MTAPRPQTHDYDEAELCAALQQLTASLADRSAIVTDHTNNIRRFTRLAAEAAQTFGAGVYSREHRELLALPDEEFWPKASLKTDWIRAAFVRVTAGPLPPATKMSLDYAQSLREQSQERYLALEPR